MVDVAVSQKNLGRVIQVFVDVLNQVFVPSRIPAIPRQFRDDIFWGPTFHEQPVCGHDATRPLSAGMAMDQDGVSLPSTLREQSDRLSEMFDFASTASVHRQKDMIDPQILRCLEFSLLIGVGFFRRYQTDNAADPVFLQSLFDQVPGNLTASKRPSLNDFTPAFDDQAVSEKILPGAGHSDHTGSDSQNPGRPLSEHQRSPLSGRSVLSFRIPLKYPLNETIPS